MPLPPAPKKGRQAVTGRLGEPQRAWNYSLDRMADSPDLDLAEFDRASHDEARGCAYSRVRRAYLEF